MNNQYIYKENGYEIMRRDLNNRNKTDEENLINFVNGISNKKNLNKELIIKMLIESFNETKQHFIDNTIETNNKIRMIFK